MIVCLYSSHLTSLFFTRTTVVESCVQTDLAASTVDLGHIHYFSGQNCSVQTNCFTDRLLASITTLSAVSVFFLNLVSLLRNSICFFFFFLSQLQCKLQDTKGVVKDAEDTFLDEQQ